MIHHRNRGGQYAEANDRAVLHHTHIHIRPSMSRAGHGYDNTFMESGFGTIKTELEMTDYVHQPAARREIREYIAYDNLERKYSTLGYLSPHQFELRQIKKFDCP